MEYIKFLIEFSLTCITCLMIGIGFVVIVFTGNFIQGTGLIIIGAILADQGFCFMKKRWGRQVFD